MLVPAFIYLISVSSTNQLQYLLCVLFSVLHIIVVFFIILKLTFQKFILVVSFTNSTVTFGLINTYEAYYYSVKCVAAKFKVLIYAFPLPAFITHIQPWYFSHNKVLGLLFFCIFFINCTYILNAFLIGKEEISYLMALSFCIHSCSRIVS